MEILLVIFITILGAIVGSFLNVVIFRMNTGMTLGGRSRCFSCRKELRWFELVPVFSFLFQRGRCRRCGSKISPQYIAVELTTALVFLGIGLRFLSSALLNPFVWISIAILFVLFGVLIVLSVYDIHHKIVPDSLVIPFIVISFISIFFRASDATFLLSPSFSLPTLWHGLAGLLLPLPFFLIWAASKGRLMGFGDIKIMMGIGWLLGLAGGVSAVILAFWIGALFSLSVMGFQQLYHLFPASKRFIMKTEIPFAPFLVMGVYAVLIFNFNLFSFISF